MIFNSYTSIVWSWRIEFDKNLYLLIWNIYFNQLSLLKSYWYSSFKLYIDSSSFQTRRNHLIHPCTSLEIWIKIIMLKITNWAGSNKNTLRESLRSVSFSFISRSDQALIYLLKVNMETLERCVKSVQS